MQATLRAGTWAVAVVKGPEKLHGYSGVSQLSSLETMSRGNSKLKMQENTLGPLRDQMVLQLG